MRTTNKPVNMKGKKIGRLTVLSLHGSDKSGLIWKCRCSCGKTTTAYGHSLRRSTKLSCGCWHDECARTSSRTHGRSSTKEYKIWAEMIQRCTNPNNRHYESYGGRGIKVCQRWVKFENFFADMGERPSQEHSIERRNNDGEYSQKNCYWATREEQQNNMRTNVRLTYRGVTMTIPRWAKLVRISPENIRNRLKMGWSVERSLETPVV